MRDEETIAEEAAEWWMRRGEGGAEHRARFMAWLDADPRHAEAMEAIEAAWTGAANPGDLEDEIDVLCDAALAGARKQKQGQWNTPATRRGLLAGIAASAAAAVVVWQVQTRETVEEFTTGIGQTTEHKLTDGTVIRMDANSRLRVALKGRRRTVELVQGQALFDVAHDPKRPFFVTTPQASVRVVGTLFSVEYRQSETHVTLARGKVEVSGSQPGSAPQVMQPGDRYSARADQASSMIHQVDTDKAFAWRDGRLFFENERLDHVVARLNDYSQPPIRLEGAAVQSLRISGTYQSGRTAEFLKALRIYYGLSISEGNGIVTIRSQT